MRVWRLSSSDFDAGEPDGVRIGTPGEVRPGFATTRVAIDAQAVWSARATRWLGVAGNRRRGRVLRVQGGDVKEVAKLGAVLVTSLAAGDGGVVYAGTLPGGGIYAITKDGRRRSTRKSRRITCGRSTSMPRARRLRGHRRRRKALRDRRDVPEPTRRRVHRPPALRLEAEAPALARARRPWWPLRRQRRRGDPLSRRRAGARLRDSRLRGQRGARARVRRRGRPLCGGQRVRGTQGRGPGARGQSAAGGVGAASAAPFAAALARPGAGKGKGSIGASIPTAASSRSTRSRAARSTRCSRRAMGRWAATAPEVACCCFRRTTPLTPCSTSTSDRRRARSRRRAVLCGTADGGASTDRVGAAERADLSGQAARRGLHRDLGQRAGARPATRDDDTRAGNTAKPDASWSDWQPVAAGGRAGDEAWGRVRSPPARYSRRARWPRGSEAALSEIAVHHQPRNQRARVSEISVGDEKGSRKKSGGAESDGAPPPKSAPAAGQRQASVKLAGRSRIPTATRWFGSSSVSSRRLAGGPSVVDPPDRSEERGRVGHRVDRRRHLSREGRRERRACESEPRHTEHLRVSDPIWSTTASRRSWASPSARGPVPAAPSTPTVRFPRSKPRSTAAPGRRSTLATASSTIS